MKVADSSPDSILPEKRPKWVPYEHAWTETPFLFFLRGCLPAWYRVRNALLRNAFCDLRLPWLPFVKPWHRSLTLGEVLVMLPILAGTLAFSVAAIIGKWDVEMTGSAAGWPVIAVLAFASRNSLATFLLGIPFERALFWHKLIGTVAVVALTWVHGARALIGGGDGGEDEEEGEDDGFLSGLILGGVFTAFPVLSPWFFRRHLFNFWYLTHLVLVVLAAVFSALHGYGGIFLGLAVWGVDVLIRYIYLALITAPKTCEATRLPANVIRLTFKRDEHPRFHYSAGQYCFLMVPGINVFEWHPFTLSSAPHQDTVSVHIRVLGNWTRNLFDLIEKKGGGPVTIPAYWEGPYGSPEIDIEGDKYKLFLLVSGGIGITPMQSIANELTYQAEEMARPIKKIWFVWSCADKYMVSANFAHDDAWRGKETAPPLLPLSFQPDSVSHKVWFVWSCADKYMVSANFAHDDAWRGKETAPPLLPLSFQPDSVSHKVWFVWSCADKYMVSANFAHDDAWRGKETSPPLLPLSFQPDSVSHKANVDEALFHRRKDPPPPDLGPVLHTEFYLTRVRAEAELEDANIKPELQPFLKLGRPDLKEIFATYRSFAAGLGESAVGVMVCGPKGLVDDVRSLCGSEAKDGVRFDYHAEIFEF